MSTIPRWLVAVFAVAVLATLSAGGWIYHGQRQHAQQEAERTLEAIARLKVDQIAAWRENQLDEAAGLATGFSFVESVVRWLTDPHAEASGDIRSRFLSRQQRHDYRDILLMDAGGQVRLSLSGRTGPLHVETSRAVAAALGECRPVLTDLYMDGGSVPSLDAIAPMLASGAMAPGPVGAVVLQNDARQALYRLIQSWSVPSSSAEVLLVRRDGNAVLLLNDPRHQPDAALTLRIPLNRTDVPAVMAVLGRTGVVQGRDYRGVEVIAVLKPIPGSPWFLVVKEDATEALAQWRSRSLLILVLISGLLITASGAAGVIWQRHAKTHYRALFEIEAAARQSEERYRSLVASSPDAMLLTGPGGILAANEAACRLFGRSEQEMIQVGRSIVVDGSDPRLAEAIDDRVRKGRFRRELTLVRKDGTRFPAEICMAVFADRHGGQCVSMTIRDLTERKQAEEALRESGESLREAQAMGRIGSWEFDVESQEIVWSDQTYKLYDRDPALGPPTVEEEAAYYSPEQVKTLRTYARRAIEEGRDFEYDLEAQLPGRRPVYFSARIRPVEDAHGRVTKVFGTVQDITERKRVEEHARQEAAHTRSLLRLAERLNTTRDSLSVLRNLCQETALALDVRAVAVRLVGENGMLHQAVSEGLPPEWADASPALSVAEHLHLATSADGVILWPDVQQAAPPRFADVYARFDIRSMMAVLIKTRKDVVGVIPVSTLLGTVVVYARGARRDFGSEELELLSGLASIAAQALTDARLFEQTLKQTARLRLLAIRLSEAEERERARLARDLHDQVGQTITALGINLNLAALDLTSGRFDGLSRRLAASQELVKETVRSIRAVLLDLRPAALDDYGLLAALQTVGSHLAAESGVRFVVEGEEPRPRLHRRTESVLYRIAQESVTNAVRHAKATLISIGLLPAGDSIRMIIADDGCGFDLANRKNLDSPTWGLLTMEERASTIDATLHIETAPGAGTRVVVEVQR